MTDTAKNNGILAEDRRKLLEVWNDTRRDYPRDACLHELVEAQAARTPNSVAVEFEGEKLTYAQLNARANQLAHRLRKLGVGPDSMVAFLLHRSLNLAVATLGILKSGAAYVPMDPEYPKDRLEFMRADTKAVVLLTEEALRGTLDAGSSTTLFLDTDWPAMAAESTANPASGAKAGNLCYVIYTSGSTGRPKGVMIEHRAAVNILLSIARDPGFTAADTMLAVTTMSFDISVSEIFLPLIVGGRIVIASRKAAQDGRALRQLVESVQPTFMQPTPITWRMLLEAGWAGSPKLVIGSTGEPLPRALADRLFVKGASLWNLYGPTETAIWSTLCRVEDDGRPVHIGRPVANTTLYVLDENRHLVPPGAEGELYIGGDGVARGYLNRPELTEEKFVPDPFTTVPGARMYRTGDLVRYRPDGNLECLGRMDFQVKIRGLRVELGEIETALGRQPSVRDAVVMAHQDTSGEKCLVGYLVCAPGKAPTPDQLRQALKDRLPDYMVPAFYIFLDEFPRTANGKVDRNKLPAPTRTPHSPSRKIHLAANARQGLLVQAWEEILGINPISIDDNFFDLGGHSLLAMAIASKVEKRTGKQISLADFYRHPTIARLAAHLDHIDPDKPVPSLEEIQSDGTRPLLVCVPSLFDLSRHLGADQPFYGASRLCLEAMLDTKTPLEQIAANYVAELKGIQRNGPYFIAGHSFGGVVAYEIARQLADAGNPIGLLVLIDPDPPRPFPVDTYRFTRFAFHLAKLLKLPFAEKKRHLLQNLQNIANRSLPVTMVSEHEKWMREYYRKTGDLHQTYHPKPFHGNAVMFLSTDVHWRFHPKSDPRNHWSKMIPGKLEVFDTPGNHESVVFEPHIQGLAKKIKDCLTEAVRAAR